MWKLSASPDTMPGAVRSRERLWGAPGSLLHPAWASLIKHTIRSNSGFFTVRRDLPGTCYPLIVLRARGKASQNGTQSIHRASTWETHWWAQDWRHSIIIRGDHFHKCTEVWKPMFLSSRVIRVIRSCRCRHPLSEKGPFVLDDWANFPGTTLGCLLVVDCYPLDRMWGFYLFPNLLVLCSLRFSYQLDTLKGKSSAGTWDVTATQTTISVAKAMIITSGWRKALGGRTQLSSARKRCLNCRVQKWCVCTRVCLCLCARMHLPV